ncbi:MAG: peptidase M14 [Gammaproteobacteria bacterium]|nr:peptidase M14 [Gammaproteobacteria bacterium]
MRLTELERIPDGLLELPAAELHRLLPGPTLIHLPGRRPAPLFVSTLLHGNEDTGWNALRALLGERRGRPLPRALSIFLGNVSAARAGLRRLDGQPDYNRIWPGGERDTGAEADVAAQVVARMRARAVFASIDIHNNTGLNPHYGCVNRLAPEFLHLASLFSRTAVYFTRPTGVQSAAFAPLCPAVALECGKPGTRSAETEAAQYVDAVLHLAQIPRHDPDRIDLDLYHTLATVRVRETLSFAFGDADADIAFVPELDHLNFRELPAGTALGRLRTDTGIGLDVRDERDEDVGAHYFRRDGDTLRTRVPVVPAMLTLDPRAVRLDCLCYLMERLAPGAPAHTRRTLDQR